MTYLAKTPEGLLPCPFCGGEAHIDSDYSSELDHTFWQVWHDCDTNPGPVRHTYGHALSLQISTPWCASDEAAIELWNRRSERTYHPERVSTAYHSAIVCSECKRRLDEVTLYCPFCGSRLEGIGHD